MNERRGPPEPRRDLSTPDKGDKCVNAIIFFFKKINIKLISYKRFPQSGNCDAVMKAQSKGADEHHI